MRFLFENKINFPPSGSAIRPDIVIAMSDSDLAALYSLHCSAHGLTAVHAPSLEILPDIIALHQPRLVLIDASYCQEEQARDFFAKRQKHYPHLPLVTVGFEVEGQSMQQFLSQGVVQHVNRRLVRSQDIPVIVKTFLL